MRDPNRMNFWHEAFSLRGSVTPRIFRDVLLFGLIATLIVSVVVIFDRRWAVWIDLEETPFEIAGAALSVLLVLRTNAGYERWWEARKLWGGIVNQARNLVISGLAYGPRDPHWRSELIHWAAAYPHVVRHSLRGQSPATEVVNLVGQDNAAKIAAAPHMPSYVALQLAELLQQGAKAGDLDHFAFLQIDKERALLIDHVGGCERILKTPLPLVYSIKIRRYLAMFLLTLPLVLLHNLQIIWLTPLMTMLVAYPLLSVDQIGIELQNPFLTGNLGHLPLSEISATIERNLLGLLKADRQNRT
ncbi:bestrophin family protein [Blastopirellula marina]|nr:bestrophin family ion channel [Blastopirellula marina]